MIVACAIDFESTGLDTERERITEYGAILFEEEGGSFSELSRAGALIYEKDYPQLPQEVIDVTGITDEDLKIKGVPFDRMIYALLAMFQSHKWPDVFIAHNKSFDEQIFKWEMKRHKQNILEHFGVGEMDRLFSIPWLCTIDDIKHPAKFKCKKLSHLALDYGVTVNPRLLHRAVDDVDLLVRMLFESEMTLDKMITYARKPWVTVRALVPKPFGPSGDGGVGKDAAKAAGFGWERPPGTYDKVFSQAWVKRIKQDEMSELTEKLGYEICVVEKI